LPLWIFLMIQNPDSQDSADSDLAPQGPSRAESELARFLGSPFSGQPVFWAARFLGKPVFWEDELLRFFDGT
jgi:hypothetical protein